MERYLIEQYGVYEDVNYLTSVDDIEDYFTDEGREFLECGQGFFQDEAEVICKIGDKFYDVNIQAEIGSAKQDVGDRLYWVEDISKVVYEEIEKPKPKPVAKVRYTAELTNYQQTQIERYMDENFIDFEKEDG